MELPENQFSADWLINAAISPKGWIDTLRLMELFNHKINELGVSKNQALKIIDIETKSFDGFMQGNSSKIDYLTILKLSTLLEISPTVFVDKFLTRIVEENRDELEKTKIRYFIARNFDLKGLQKINFIETVNDFDHIEARILNFFGYDSVFQYQNNLDVPVYSSGKITSNKESLSFWVNMAYASFNRISNPNEYDREALTNLFPTLRAYSLNMEHGLTQVARILFKVGVTLIFIPKIYKDLHIRAATFCIDDKPCIALTNYKDFYPTIWFSLFHELYHVLYDWDEISASDSKSHLSAGLSTAMIDEEAANNFASRYLFDEDQLLEVEPNIDNAVFVKKYARSHNIHESIVYAIHGFKYKRFGKYVAAGLIPTPKSAIADFKPAQYESYAPIPKIVNNTISLIN
jgi:HTH-type transcriptional regulator / antitoxin HigA